MFFIPQKKAACGVGAMPFFFNIPIPSNAGCSVVVLNNDFDQLTVGL